MSAEGIGSALVIGGDGLIGRALSVALGQRGIVVTATSRFPARGDLLLDLSRPLDGIVLPSVSVAFLCAGATVLATCRQKPEETRLVNVTAPLALARRLAAEGTLVVGLSTNLVFDGTIPMVKPDWPATPVSEYGRQKVALELGLGELDAAACVVRLTKVIGAGTPLFRDWVAALSARRTIRPFSDLVLAPLALSDVAETLIRVASWRLSGVVQLSGRADVTYADVAIQLARRLGLPATLVEPTTVGEAGVVLETHPPHTTLDTARARQDLDWHPPTLTDVLEKVWPHAL